MQCKALTKDGQPCRAPATSPDGYCFFHADPSRASRLGRSGGKKNRRSQIQIQIPEKIDAAALRDLTMQGLRAIASGDIDSRAATAFFGGCNCLQRQLQTIRDEEVERKLAKLEQMVAEQNMQKRTAGSLNSVDSAQHSREESSKTHDSVQNNEDEHASTTPHPDRGADFSAEKEQLNSGDLEQAYEEEEDNGERED